VLRAAGWRAVKDAERGGLLLGDEQLQAYQHVTSGSDLALVVGYAGTCKSAMLGVAHAAWEAQGYTVRGAALSGIAAEGLEAGSGIASRTLASLEFGWKEGRDALTRRDVLVVDEAGLVGSRQMERVLSHAQSAGAKVVLICDPEQLQAIEAGAAFRALAERHGAADISEVRRQRVAWQREATRELATARTAEALDRYMAAGMVQPAETHDTAKAALVAGWDAVRQESSQASQVILAYTRDDVRDLNALAWERLRATGQLGPDQAVQTERSVRAFAAGDRVMFQRNERALGGGPGGRGGVAVKNGTLGTVLAVEAGGERLTVRLDGAGGPLPPENPDARYSTIPVALIQAPNGPRIPQLLTSIRAALGQPAGRRESTPSAGIPPASQAEPWPASPSFVPKLTGSCVASASGSS
jgi:Ti-type conjugative transfer relaxase TraA